MSNQHTISTILIVEDEPLVRMHGVDILEDAGFQVREASSADEALIALEDGTTFHVLFSDIDMPGSMNGMALARVVHERWPAIRVLMTSGNPPIEAEPIPGEGKFLRKPWTSERLVECLKVVIAN